jgi:peptidoglycan/xylan/chitin deacetylase (PgdA/CDA1 family)
LAYGVRGRSSSLFGPSVWRGPADRRALALTFDDGPSESTPRLLELLERHGARATFFQCGANVRRLPRIAGEVARGGHEVGNHSDSHPRFYFRSASFIRGELARAQAAIAEAAGVAPVLCRIPYGARWFGLRAAQRSLGLLGVMWTAIGLDWKLPPAAVASRLARRAVNGAILCLHDGRATQPGPDIGPTLEAVRRLLPELQSRGFQFRTVSDLICPQN